MRRFSGRPFFNDVVTGLLAAVRIRYGFRTLDVVREGGRWKIVAQINPHRELLRGDTLSDQEVMDLLRAEVVLIPQDRHGLGLATGLTVEETARATFNKVSHKLPIRTRLVRRRHGV